MIDLDLIRSAWLAENRLGTHWDGCELTHWRCAIHRLCDEVERLRETIKKLEGTRDE